MHKVRLQRAAIRQLEDTFFGIRLVKTLLPGTVKIYGVDEVHDHIVRNTTINNGWYFLFGFFADPVIYHVWRTGISKIQCRYVCFIKRMVCIEKIRQYVKALSVPNGVSNI